MIPWKGGDKACDLYLRHDRFPESQDIIDACGIDIFNTWITTPICSQATNHGDMTQCEGLFAKFIGSEDHEFFEQVELPVIETQVKAVNCIPG